MFASAIETVSLVMLKCQVTIRINYTRACWGCASCRKAGILQFSCSDEPPHQTKKREAG